MGDFLGYAVVGDLKILGVQVGDHFAFVVVNDHGGADQCGLDFDVGLGRGLLNGDAGTRGNGAFRSLRMSACDSQRREEKERSETV
jgi:hypothetical protein